MAPAQRPRPVQLDGRVDDVLRGLRGQQLRHRGPAWHVWLITAYGVLVAPFVEEALFRGLLHPAARARIGAAGATVGVAVVFALVHTNVYAFFPLLVLALFLGWLLETTDSLVATFTVHALFNASGLLPILIFRYA